MSESGNLPEGWHIVTFGDVARNVSEYETKPLEKGLDRCVGLDHIEPGSLHIKRWDLMSNECSFTRKFKKGQVLFGKRRAYQRKVAIAEFDGICSSDILVFEANKEKLVPDLLPFIVQDDRFFDFAIGTSSGSLSPRTKWQFLSTYKVPIPPKEEQQRISSLLWAAEDCIVKNERFIDEAERAKQILMREIFTKGIGHTEFKDVKEIGKMPIKWEVKSFNDLTYKIQDGTHFTPHYIKKGIPFLRVTDIQGPFIDLDKVKFISQEEHLELTKRCKPEKGDILYSKNGTIGIVKLIDWDWEFSIFVSLCLIKPKIEIIETKFICYVLESEVITNQLRTRAKQMTVTNLHLEEIKELKFPVPSKNEQTRIIAILDSYNEMITTARVNLTATKVLKMKLINQLFPET